MLTETILELETLLARATTESQRHVDEGDDAQAAAVHSWHLLVEATTKSLELARRVDAAAPAPDDGEE